MAPIWLTKARALAKSGKRKLLRIFVSPSNCQPPLSCEAIQVRLPPVSRGVPPWQGTQCRLASSSIARTVTAAVAVVVCYVVCAIVWSTTWYAIRVCIGDGGYPTLPAAAIRFTIAALVLGALVWVGFGRPRPRGRRQLTWLAVAGAFNGLAYAMVYRAEDTLPGGVVAVVFGTYSLFTAIGASITDRKSVV